MYMLEQGCARSKNLIDFNQNIIANLSLEIKKILQDHSTDPNNKNYQECVRKSIADFYRKNGMNTFVYFDKNNNIQVSATIKDPVNNLCVFFLSKWIQESKNKFKSQTLDDNETLSQEDFSLILQYAKTCVDSNNDLLFRDIVRNAIKKTFNLTTRDGLFFSKLGVYFKIFDFKFVKISNEIRSVQKLSTARLLDDEDRLKINACLKKINLEDLISENVSYVLNTKMNLENVSNIDFSKNFLFLVTQELRIHLEKILDGKIPGILQTCFAEEKIRSRKNLIYEKVSNKLLEMLYNNSNGARDFIDFYQGQTIHIDGQEISIPIIIDTTGEKWSLEKIENTAVQKFEIQIKINSLQDQADKAGQTALNLETDINEIQNEISIKNKILSETDLIYEKKKKELQNLKTDEMIQKETISISLAKYLEEKKSLLNEIETLSKEIEDTRSKKLKFIQEQKNIQQAIEKENEENQIKFIQYNMLVNALSNAIGGVKLES